MGADVVKVEPLEGEPWRQPEPILPTENRWFLSLNRGKKGIAVNLKTEEGQALVHRLVPGFDVVIINYRPDTAAKLGVDYQTLSAINPGLVYLEMTAFGRKGPDAHRPGYDIVVQALTGLMAADAKTDDAGVPRPIAPAVADFTSGFAVAWGVCAGLFARERTGRGQKIEGSLMSTALAMQTSRFLDVPDVPAGTAAGGEIFERIRRAKADGASFAELQAMRQEALAARPPSAYYRCYFTADSVIALGCLSPVLRRKAAEAVGVDDPRNDDPTLPHLGPEAYALAVQVMADFEAKMLGRTTDEWIKVFDAVGVPAGPYYDVTELMDHPQVVANDLVTELRHSKVGRVRMVGPVFKMSETPTAAQGPSPTLGEHTDDVLASIGCSPDDIAGLRARGVVG